MTKNDSLDDDSNKSILELAKKKHAGLTVVGMALITVLIVVAIGWGLFKPGVLDQLKDSDYARGVITFIVVIGTIGIALIVTFAGLQRGRTQDERDDAKERFVRAKEILTIMVGILGTIIGFYFGSADGDQAAAEQAELSIAGPMIVDTGEPGGSIAFTAKVSGGEPPYTYSISCKPEGLVEGITDQETEDGEVTEEITLPEVESATELTMTVSVADQNEVTGEAETTVEIEPPTAEPESTSEAEEPGST